MPPLTIDELIFKGTHNSYACRSNGAPTMNHPPQTQIDDFGVWALEIDYGLDVERGGPVAVVGHNRPGNASCWGHYLTDYLALIKSAKSLQYRPAFLCFDLKSWKRWWLRFWRVPGDRAFSWDDKWQAGLEALRTVCGDDGFVILEDWLREHDGRWPDPHELAGQLVIYEPNKRDGDGRLLGMRGTHASRHVTPAQAENAIETGEPLQSNGSTCEGGARVLRLDQYQADWTFAYGVPPNPIVVDPRAGESSIIDDAEGRRWRFGVERSHSGIVGEQGTYRFPYRSIEAAVARARGVTPATNGAPDDRRAGYGWTLLVRNMDVSEGDLPPELGLKVEFENS